MLLEPQHFVRGRIVELGACAACRPRAPSGWSSPARSTTIRPRLARKMIGCDGFLVSAASTSCQPPLERDLADVEDHVGEVLEEHARPHLALGAVHRDLAADLAERLVGVGHRLEHHPRRDAPADHGEHQDRAQQAIRADAAGHHHDEFAVGRQPAEADQEADQQRHRDGQRQRLRQQRDRQPQHRPPGTPLAIICSARSMMNGIIRMNVKTSSAMRNGGRISRMTYRSMIAHAVSIISLRHRPASSHQRRRPGSRW